MWATFLFGKSPATLPATKNWNPEGEEKNGEWLWFVDATTEHSVCTFCERWSETREIRFSFLQGELSLDPIEVLCGSSTRCTSFTLLKWFFLWFWFWASVFWATVWLMLLLPRQLCTPITGQFLSVPLATGLSNPIPTFLYVCFSWIHDYSTCLCSRLSNFYCQNFIFYYLDGCFVMGVHSSKLVLPSGSNQ